MPSTDRPHGRLDLDPEKRPTDQGFDPPAWLRSRHLQSVITQAPWRRRHVSQNATELLDRAEEKIIDCENGARLQGFLTRATRHDRGCVVLLHGWEGSAHSSYILSAGGLLLAAGFSVFRLNLRDHGDTKSLNQGLFHSCRIDEVVDAVGWVKSRIQPRWLAVVGQSLGGNFAMRIAVRAKSAGLALDRVLAVCPVLKPHSTMRALDEGLWVYRRYFLSRWRRSLTAKAAAFPETYQFGDLSRFDNLTDTTEFFVERYTEFGSLDQYLTGYAITGDVLAELSVSSRIILADDDPVIPIQDLADVARSSALELTLSPHGGHCGFVDRLFGPTWVDREIVDDLRRLT